MRRIVLALASALSVGALQSASAADIPAPVYKAPPAAVVVSNWTGCYIGINGGYGWGRKDFSNDTVGDLGSHTATGGVAGGQAGCDYQTGPWVFGIRGMFDWADLTGSNITPAGTLVANTRVGSFATAVGRVGYTLMPNTLVYALGGFAWVRDQHWFTTLDGVEIASTTVNRTGYDVGIGLEHMFAPGWSAFIEYDYLGFNCKINTTVLTTNFLGPTGAVVPVNIEQNVS